VNTAPFTEVRDNFKTIVDDVCATGDEYVVTRHGKPVAVILSYDEYESLVESLNLLSDDAAMAAISDGLADAEAGELVTLEEV
jgi:prevent-host-death family protein